MDLKSLEAVAPNTEAPRSTDSFLFRKDYGYTYVNKQEIFVKDLRNKNEKPCIIA